MNQNETAFLNILLAEDDLDDQELLAEAFAEINPSVSLLSFSTGKEFLHYLEQLPNGELPQLILLDYNIPEMNGAEILGRLLMKERYDRIIKLVWSTSNSQLYEKSCLELGARAYLVKPSNVSGLLDLAKQILNYVQDDKMA